MLDITPNCRFYFCDLGVADYFLNMAGAPPDMIAGSINENFVYLYLDKEIDKLLFRFIYQVELDFVLIEAVGDRSIVLAQVCQ